MAHGIPITYVPARNTIFLSFALAWAEVLGRATSLSASMRWIIRDIPIAGRSLLRPLRRWRTWHQGRRGGLQALRIHTPLIALTKAEIIQKGIELGVDYG